MRRRSRNKTSIKIALSVLITGEVILMLMRNSVCLFVLQPPRNGAKEQLVWLHHHFMPSSKQNLAVNFQRAPLSFAASFS